jgi:ATP-dependent Clp protease ATP-binding subunit ClpA
VFGDRWSLLAGLMAEGVAAAILENLHVSVEAIRSSSHRLFGPSQSPATDEIPPMSTEAKCALDAAAFKAAASDSNSSAPEVRTEHLLAILVLDPGSRARRVLNDLDVDIAAIKRELQCYLTLSRSRPARWWKRRAPTQDGCSFCGRALPGAGQLVHGPGVAICSACVALAGDILDDRQPIRPPSHHISGPQ